MLFGRIPISVSYSPTTTGKPLKLSTRELPVSQSATPDIFLSEFFTERLYTELIGVFLAISLEIRLTMAKQATVDTASTERLMSK